MREFYSEKMTNYIFSDKEKKDNDNLPYVGILENNEEDNKTFALFHYPIEYFNAKKEVRFLVMIELIKNGYTCHVCSARIDLFTFKENLDHKYELISLTKKPIEHGAWGRANISSEELSQKLKTIGNYLTGSFIRDSYSSTGITNSVWQILQFPEDDFIRIYELTDASSDNSGQYNDYTPLEYAYDSDIEVINNNSTFYDIKVKYFGEKPNKKKENSPNRQFKSIFI